LGVVRDVGYPPGFLDRFRRYPLAAATPMAEAIRTGNAVWCASHADRVRRFPDLADGRPPRHEASIAVPLTDAGTTVGGMILVFAEPRGFGEEELAFLDALARQCALAIRHARLYEAERLARARAEASAARARFPAEAGIRLSAELDEPALLHQLAKLVVPALAEWCVFDMVDAQGGTRRSVASPGGPEADAIARELTERFPLDLDAEENVVVRVMRTGTPSLLGEVPD
jgi:hypothetical protein